MRMFQHVFRPLPILTDQGHAELVTDLEQMQNQLSLYQTIFDHLPAMMLVYKVVSRTEFRLIARNQITLEHLDVFDIQLGTQPSDLFSAHEAARIVHYLQTAIDTDAVVEGEDQVLRDQGQSWCRHVLIPLHDAHDVITSMLVILRNITRSKQQEHAERIQQTLRMDQQASMLAELSTPLLTISDETVVMPLIGSIDTQRAEQMSRTLLEGVATSQARHVILDITGVPLVDTYVAGVLLRMAQAVRLLGAQIILTGIRPEIAHTLVRLGIDLQGVVTRNTLRDGIAYALQR